MYIIYVYSILFRGCDVFPQVAREVADPEKRMVGTSVKYSTQNCDILNWLSFWSSHP